MEQRQNSKDIQIGSFADTNHKQIVDAEFTCIPTTNKLFFV
jgi:hypothetical protein